MNSYIILLTISLPRVSLLNDNSRKLIHQSPKSFQLYIDPTIHPRKANESIVSLQSNFHRPLMARTRRKSAIISTAKPFTEPWHFLVASRARATLNSLAASAKSRPKLEKFLVHVTVDRYWLWPKVANEANQLQQRSNCDKSGLRFREKGRHGSECIHGRTKYIV